MIHESLKRIEDSNRTERSRGILEPQRGGKSGREQIPSKRELEPGGNRQTACGPYGPRGFESHPRRHIKMLFRQFFLVYFLERE